MAGEPRDDDPDFDADRDALQHGSARPEDKAPEAGYGVFVLALTFAAGISGLLFGCKYRPCLPD